MAWKGPFKPTRPEKYIGDPAKIVFRSRIELRYMQYIDLNDDIVAWNSECTVIPYFDPSANKHRRYFPDLLIKRKDGVIMMIELKHTSEASEPRPKKQTRRALNEVRTWATNNAKWEAAKKYCEERGWLFKVLTEKELGRAY